MLFVCAFELPAGASARALTPQEVRARTCARLCARNNDKRERCVDETARSAAQKVMVPLASRPDQRTRTCYHHSPTRSAR